MVRGRRDIVLMTHVVSDSNDDRNRCLRTSRRNSGCRRARRGRCDSAVIGVARGDVDSDKGVRAGLVRSAVTRVARVTVSRSWRMKVRRAVARDDDRRRRLVARSRHALAVAVSRRRTDIGIIGIAPRARRNDGRRRRVVKVAISHIVAVEASVAAAAAVQRRAGASGAKQRSLRRVFR